MPASGSQQTLQITLSPWVGIQWDLNVIQAINLWCTLFVVIGRLALTVAFSHLELCDNRLSSTGNGKSGSNNWTFISAIKALLLRKTRFISVLPDLAWPFSLEDLRKAIGERMTML
jgi:hypothetical protein